MSNLILRPTALLHHILSSYITPGDVVVDGTTGRGNDTCFLADAVEKTGRVYGFDLQACALEETRTRLEEAGSIQRCRLIQATHEEIRCHLEPGDIGRIAVMIFNLGYLPGGDHLVTTRADSTLAALEDGLYLIKKDGIIGVVVYPGHGEGQREKDALIEWTKELSASAYHVAHICLVNQTRLPPEIFLITKKQEGYPSAGD